MTPEYLRLARAAYRQGLRRSDAARARGQVHRHDWKPKPQAQRHADAMAALAEWTVAHITGRRWLNASSLVPDDPAAGDVEGGLQVRWSWRRNGSLLIHEDDHPELKGVLVVGDVPVAPPLIVVGWLPVPEAWRPEWWRADVRNPAYFVRQAYRVLRPIAELIVDKNSDL